MRLKDLVTAVKATIKEIPCEDVAHYQAQGYRLLDVREPAEYLEGTIPMSLHVPRGILEPKCDTCFENHEGDLADLNQPWIVYCQAGGRGALATHTLMQLGFTNVVNMAGGFNAWKAFGGDVTVPPEEKGLMRCDHPWNPGFQG